MAVRERATSGGATGRRISSARAVEQARCWIDAEVARGAAGQRVTLAALARATGVSAFHLQRQFRAALGVTPAQYARMRRAARLRNGLRSGETVSRAVYGAGYGSGSRVYSAADAEFGMTPAAYRRGGAGIAIRYTVVGSPLGRVLVAVTTRGVCAVSLGDDDATLERDLRAEYPRATVERVDAGDAWVASLVRGVATSLAGGATAAEIPLDVRGTAFQWSVWHALLRIPMGETRTYSELARSIGRPTAARAVARACASNRAAVIVPCHRVVREDGSLGGYRWGVERKARLLAAERGAEAIEAGGHAPRAPRRQRAGAMSRTVGK